MGIIRYVLGARREAKHAAPKTSSGKGGKHRAPIGGVQCNHHWTTGADHTHRCGDEPHNRGDHHCFGGDNWKCAATQPYGK